MNGDYWTRKTEPGFSIGRFCEVLGDTLANQKREDKEADKMISEIYERRTVMKGNENVVQRRTNLQAQKREAFAQNIGVSKIAENRKKTDENLNVIDKIYLLKYTQR